MANPNPSPETRFKPGQRANPSGKSSETQRAEQKAAAIAAELRCEILSSLKESVSREDMGPLERAELLQKLVDPATLKLFKDSEDRAHGTPTNTNINENDGVLNVHLHGRAKSI